MTYIKQTPTYHREDDLSASSACANAERPAHAEKQFQHVRTTNVANVGVSVALKPENAPRPVAIAPANAARHRKRCDIS